MSSLPDLYLKNNEQGLQGVARHPVASSLLSPLLTQVLKDSQREVVYLQEKRNCDDLLTSSQINDLVLDSAKKLGFDLSSFERDQVMAWIEIDQKPFGILQELIEDSNVTDVIITGYSSVSIQQGRDNLKTDICFPDQDTYEAFVEKILKKAGGTYSTRQPIADGMIGSYARIHAVHKSISDAGPYVTIRINRFSEISTEQLIQFGAAPSGIFDYLKAVIGCGQTVLVTGEVGTGKTTLTRALASTVSHKESILVIEDTPEIRLEHPHVRYIRTRAVNTDGAGRITPAQCIRAGMRMAMNRIIFGEMRDAEAAEAFIDVCASGHPGISTMHAKSSAEALTRLELFLGRAQKGVIADIIARQISTAVQVIVHVDSCKITGKKRIFEVREIGAAADKVLRQREIFRYEPNNGLPGWKVVNRISNYQEYFSRLGYQISLNSYPAYLELNLDTVYREAVYGGQ